MKKVVIIDDEKDVVTYLAAMLLDNDYEVHTATNGKAGFDLVKQLKPDLVCLDILMPGETGVSLFRKIRSSAGLKKIPVIIISGMSFGDEVGNGDLRPPEHYMEKPVRPDQFLETVRSVIG